MRWKVLIALAASFLLVVSIVYLGTSHTGLFYLDTEDVKKTDEKIKQDKWKFLGQVNISSGSIAELGTQNSSSTLD